MRGAINSGGMPQAAPDPSGSSKASSSIMVSMSCKPLGSPSEPLARFSKHVKAMSGREIAALRAVGVACLLLVDVLSDDRQLRSGGSQSRPFPSRSRSRSRNGLFVGDIGVG